VMDRLALETLAMVQQLSGDKPLDCICHACIDEHDLRSPTMPLLSLNSFCMIVCQNCGNKRCPKASDHRNECTNSNEPGQSGSVYAAKASVK
jgi:hypothetical protein